MFSGRLQSIWRYPIKGFTPQPLDAVTLTVGEPLPFDRLYAVEDGPSGFDPSAPRHISKQRFAVLAKVAEVARVRTAYDEASGQLTAVHAGQAPFAGDLDQPDDAERFAGWLAGVLGDAARGPLELLRAPPTHRFMDDEQGFVSIINLASLRSLEAFLGCSVDPLRLRANLYVEDSAPWSEDGLVGGEVTVGPARLKVTKTITRCVATHVDPATGARDLELVRALFEGFGHTHCGLYAEVTAGGRIAPGDAVEGVA